MKRILPSPILAAAAAGVALLLLGAGSATAAAGGPPALAGAICGPQSGGSVRPVPPLASVATVRAGRHPGFDRFVVEFAGAGPVPRFDVRPQASPRFIEDPSGQPVTLLGRAGVLVVLHDSSLHDGFSGPTDLKPRLPLLREARSTGDFEGVVSWGLGVSRPACARVFTLSSPTRLVVDLVRR
jgi:hypothetical protein